MPFPFSRMVHLLKLGALAASSPPLPPVPNVYIALVKIRKMCPLLADTAFGQKAWELTHGLNFNSHHHLAEYLWSVSKLHHDLTQWPNDTWVGGKAAWSFPPHDRECSVKAEHGTQSYRKSTLLNPQIKETLDIERKSIPRPSLALNFEYHNNWNSIK